VPNTDNSKCTVAGRHTTYSNGTTQTVNNVSQPIFFDNYPAASAASLSSERDRRGSCAGTVSGSAPVSAAPQVLNLGNLRFGNSAYICNSTWQRRAPFTLCSGVTGTWSNNDTTLLEPIRKLPYNVTVTNLWVVDFDFRPIQLCLHDGCCGLVEADACLPNGQVSVQVSGQVLRPTMIPYILYQNAAL
jgi:hypothetical protein